jgi:glycosyltransferase involved in cell wall biosynthesis
MSKTEYSIVFDRAGDKYVEVCVCISLHNYECYIVETLDSVLYQTLQPLDLVIVDDLSTDGSRCIAANWLMTNQDRFNNVFLVSHHRNSGLAAARNTGFSLVNTKYVFVLDADNYIYPRCLNRCLEAIKTAKADFAYSIIERFISETGAPDMSAPLMGTENWSRDGLIYGNYIDAMALIRKDAWAGVGGYRSMNGWEDYDLWCSFAEMHLNGVHVPEILCRYRVHKRSMLNTITRANVNGVIDEMMKLHPWLKLK